MSSNSPPPVDAERVSSTSSTSSTSSADFLSLSSPAPRKKSFLSSLFHKKDDAPPSTNHDKPPADKHDSEPATITATITSAPTSTSTTSATERHSPGSNSSAAVSVGPLAALPSEPTASSTTTDASSPPSRVDSSHPAHVVSIAQLVTNAPSRTSSPDMLHASNINPAHSPSASSATAGSATSTPTSVSVGRGGTFFARGDTAAHADGADVSEVSSAGTVEDGKSLVEAYKEQAIAEHGLKQLSSRARASSDADVISAQSSVQPANSSPVPLSKSHTDLAGIAATPAPTIDSGTPSSRRRTLLNTLFKRKGGDESQPAITSTSSAATPDTPSHSNSEEQGTADNEQLTAIVVEAEETRATAEKVQAHTEKAVSAMDNLKRLLNESEAVNGGPQRERAASDPDEQRPPVRLSSHASSFTHAAADEQPKSARMETKKRLGGFFSSLRLGHKNKKAEEQQSSELADEHKESENETSPQSTTTSTSTAPVPVSAAPAASASASSSSPSPKLDYKARMQQLIERRGGGDRRRSMSDAPRAEHGKLSQSGESRELKKASVEVNATMNESNAIAARNVSLLQQMESRAAEMEDAADGMLAMARKIKEDQKKRSLFGW